MDEAPPPSCDGITLHRGISPMARRYRFLVVMLRFLHSAYLLIVAVATQSAALHVTHVRAL